jgi:HEAT repeat protein
VKYEKPLEEWIFQLENASDGVDRLQAAREVGWYPNSDTAVNSLARAAVEDRFVDVRQEAVWALGNMRRDTIVNTLILAYGDRDSRVRTAAVASLGRFRGVEVLNTLQHAFEKDPSYSVAAAALQSLASADSLHRVMHVENALKLNSYNDIIRSTALRVLAGMRDDYAFDALTKYTAYGIDPNLRIQALSHLGKQWKERDDVMYTFLRLANDRSYSVRRFAIRTLGDIGDIRVIKDLKKYAERETDKQVLRDLKGTIEKIEKAGNDND